MIKYTICPGQVPQTSDIQSNELKFIAGMFRYLEKENMEERLYNVEIGKRILLYSSEFDPDGDYECIFFTSTGMNKGYFTQRVDSPGRTHHVRSLDFTFE